MILSSGEILSDFLQGLSDIFFPPHCFNCSTPLLGEKRKYICRECVDAIGIDSPVAIETDRSAVKGFSESYSAGRHEGILKLSVHYFKYKGKIRLGREIVGEYLQRMGKEIIKFNPDYIAFVPLHPFREWRRGYNQAFIIAEEISRYVGKDIFYGLRRLKNTKQQVGLGKMEREENIKGAFGLRKGTEKVIKGKRVLIADDVVTTGGTARECGKLLRNAGAEDTALFTISRRSL